ncbi:MAG: hypothetical protein SH868_16390 [Bythopirellula sp.]|nr:hypothetical protein [Bythopirellula sp.]
MPKYALTIVMALLISLSLTRPAQAILQFQKEFITLYTPDKTTDYAKVVKQAGCFVCHQGKLRKNHNPYGVHLVELLDKKTDMKNPAKIVEALKKVAEMHSVAGDDKSPTFGELIAAGELPGGSLEDAKKEPAK